MKKNGEGFLLGDGKKKKRTKGAEKQRGPVVGQPRAQGKEK